nr:phage tail tape measure protein [Caballeronia sp. GAFFF2]
MSRLWSNTVPGGDSHGGAATGQINFSKGNNAGPKPYEESHGDTLLDQAKQAQATLEASLSGQEKLTGWAAKEVELRAEIDGYAGKTLTKAQQSVLAHQSELLAQYSLNASLEKQLDLRTRSDKLNQDAYETNLKIVDQNDAIANQHKIQLDTLSLGTKERQRQVELLSIETERQKELAEWQKKAVGLRLDGTQDDKDERDSINKRFDARRDETSNFFDKSDIASQDWMSGAKGGLQDIIDKTNDLASAANNTAQNAIGSLGDAVAEFATSGKLSFGDFVKAAVGSLIKLETEALIAKAILASFNFFGASGSEAVGASATSTPDDLIAGYGHAAGGYISGPGSGTSDSIPARLSNGEFVMTADAVRRIGVSSLNAMNSGAAVHAIARFASGGLVGAASGVSPGARGDITVSAPISVQGGADAGANASGAADLQKKITAAVRAVVVNERRQGGALWKMQQGIA